MRRSPTWAAATALVTAALLAVGCRSASGGDSSGDAADGGASGDGGEETPTADPPDPSGALVLAAENNYSYAGTLDGPTFVMAEYSDASLSWADLTEDLQCHDLDPVGDIDNAALMVFPRLTEADVEAGLSDDSLEQVDLGVYLSHEPGEETSVSLSQFTFFGTDADIEHEFAEGSGAWMVVLTTGATIGVGSRMIAFLQPSAHATETTGRVDDGCSVLEYETDLTALTPLAVLPDGPWLPDWSDLAETGMGTPLEPLKVSELMVARYDSLSAEDLETQFTDIELLADDRWTMPHSSGTTDDLSGLTHVDDGSAFPGFHAGGTWVLALRCGTCPNPAPLFLTILQPWAG